MSWTLLQCGGACGDDPCGSTPPGPTATPQYISTEYDQQVCLPIPPLPYSCTGHDFGPCASTDSPARTYSYYYDAGTGFSCGDPHLAPVAWCHADPYACVRAHCTGLTSGTNYNLTFGFSKGGTHYFSMVISFTASGTTFDSDYYSLMQETGGPTLNVNYTLDSLTIAPA